MSDVYTWVIEQMSCYPQFEGETDVVFTVYWRLNGASETAPSATGTVYGSVGVTYVAGTPFTPYALGPETVGNYEANVALQIANKINPPVVNPPLPW